jgi:hypothetical protein
MLNRLLKHDGFGDFRDKEHDPVDNVEKETPSARQPSCAVLPTVAVCDEKDGVAS